MTELDLWKKVIVGLKDKIKRPDMIVWFNGSILTRVENNTAYISLPSVFTQEWFKQRYKNLLFDAFKELDSELADIVFEVDSSLIEEGSNGVDIVQLFKGGEKRVRKVANKNEFRVTTTNENGSGSSSSFITKMLNPKYRLDNFIVGNDNRLAHAACQAVSKKPGHSYNPLFVYGNVGLGKTHLLQGTGNAIIDMHNDSLVVYGTAEKFTNEIVESIQKNNVKNFRNRYRNADCLIIDDVQFLGGKERTQEEFFHTFNELYHENKQIIISSDRPPKDLKGIDDRLVSRFEMGMIVDVTFPDYETCLAILQKKCQEMEVLISAEVLQFIAYNVQNSIRELEGVLVQAIAQAQLEDSTPTVNSVAKILNKLGKVNLVTSPDLYGESARRPLNSCDEIIDLVAEYYKLTKYDLIGERRSRDIMLPRQICIYLLKKEFNFSFEKIGTEFGGRNHTTAMHAYNKIVREIKKDQKLVKDINSIKQEIGL
jgi:chromosomal replication initiator protein